MMSQIRKTIVMTSILVMAGCQSMPSYTSMESEQDDQFNTSVAYNIDPALTHDGLNCLVIMPLMVGPDAFEPIEFDSLLSDDVTNRDFAKIQDDEIYDYELDANDKQQLLRKMLYAHISPYKTRDIELSHVDRYAFAGDLKPDYHKLSKKFSCDWFLRGQVNEFSVNYFGVYSNVVVAADLEIIRGRDQKVVWQGKHEARSDDGSVPLSPIDLAFGAVKAANNVNPEQVERVVGDLARRLTRTMPLEAGNSFLFAARRSQLMQVVASGLNLRSGPGRHFAVNKVLKNNEMVTVLKPTEKNPWLKVKASDGTEGYVSGRYLN